MGDSPYKKKRFVVTGVASILLVATVIAFVVTTRKSATPTPSNPNNEKGAEQALCSTTDYKQTCEKALSQANATTHNDLIKVSLDAALKNIGDVLNNSSFLKAAAADPTTKGAQDVCQQVLQTAVEDLKRSMDNVHVLDDKKASELTFDIRTWLTAVIANQETCIEAFEETSKEKSEKMRTELKTGRELSSNGLAMVSETSNVLASLAGRKLLAEEPEFAKRRLLQASRIDLKPTIVVAQDGSGQFKTIGEAIASLPKNNDSKVVYVKAGLYDEQVWIPKKVNFVTLVGDGPTKTRITGNKCNAKGVRTFASATVAVQAEDFFAKDIAFENTAGPEGGQAVALRVSGNRAVFFNVAMNGYQDTLYVQTYRQYYRNCTISGTVDFVFGHSLSLFQDCQFVVRKPGGGQACMVTADGRTDPRGVSGIVIQNGNITAEPAFLTAQPPHKAFLGRPWKELSTTIIMQSNIEGFIDPTGWSPWTGTFAQDTCYYAEYENRGLGSNTTGRVQWKGIRKLTPQMAQGWTGGVAFGGDEWIKQIGVPYVPTMMQI